MPRRVGSAVLDGTRHEIDEIAAQRRKQRCDPMVMMLASAARDSDVISLQIKTRGLTGMAILTAITASSMPPPAM